VEADGKKKKNNPNILAPANAGHIKKKRGKKMANFQRKVKPKKKDQGRKMTLCEPGLQRRTRTWGEKKKDLLARGKRKGAYSPKGWKRNVPITRACEKRPVGFNRKRVNAQGQRRKRNCF